MQNFSVDIKITNEAFEDMEKIYEYIANELLAPENAMGQYNRMAETIHTLDSFLEKLSLFETETEHSWGMRRIN